MRVKIVLLFLIGIVCSQTVLQRFYGNGKCEGDPYLVLLTKNTSIYCFAQDDSYFKWHCEEGLYSRSRCSDPGCRNCTLDDKFDPKCRAITSGVDWVSMSCEKNNTYHGVGGDYYQDTECAVPREPPQTFIFTNSTTSCENRIRNSVTRQCVDTNSWSIKTFKTQTCTGDSETQKLNLGQCQRVEHETGAIIYSKYRCGSISFASQTAITLTAFIMGILLNF